MIKKELGIKNAKKRFREGNHWGSEIYL